MSNKILLIRPTFDSTFSLSPPISLGYIAANLKKDGFFDVGLLDGTLYQLSLEDMTKRILDEDPSIIGIQVYTGSQNWVRKLVSMIKNKDSSITVVAGGPHISALKEDALEHIGADYGIVGEGEESFSRLVDVIINNVDELQNVPGILFREKGKIKQGKIPFARISDLDSLPSPDYELLQITKYFKHMQSATAPLRGKRPVTILTSRGCPYNCTFCSSRLTFLKRIRYRSLEGVMQELKYLKERFNIDEFHVSDDNLTLDMNRAERFFDLLIKERLNLHWRAPNGLRADRLNERLIRKMMKSGCYFVGIGVETGSKSVMKSIKKGLDLDKIGKILPIFRKYGITTSGFFMVGLMQEREGDIEKTKDFIKRSKFDRIQVSTYAPYPGSEDFDNLFKCDNKRLYKKNIRDYLYHGRIPRINNELSYARIHYSQKNMIRSFYIKPKILLNLALNVRPSQIAAILKHPWIRRWFDKEHDSYLKDVNQ